MLVDPEVIEKAVAGDTAAFNELVLAYRRRILGAVSRLIGRPEDVEDVTQEVFVRLYHSLGQLRTPSLFETWLYRLTVNSGYDYLRRAKRRRESRMSDLSEQQVSAADAVAGSKQQNEERQRGELREFVDSLFRHVSREDQLLLKLKEIEGLSLKELEAVYGIKESALKVRLFRARQRVLKAYEAASEQGSL